ncbi:MAG: RNA-binding cell elongation regulator Jag/EloR [Actinomycetota bacterium]
MTSSVEASGPTVVDAIDEALRKLGATEDEVEIEVLSEGNESPNSNLRGLARVRIRFRDERTEQDHLAAAESAAEAHEKLEPVPAAEAEKQATSVADFLEGLLQTLRLDATVEVRPTSFGVAADLHGSELAVLIGRHGTTLAALQELCRAVAQREAGTRCLVVVDIERYLVRRRETLERMALRAAAKVRKSNKEQALEAMPARDRKIIHDALTDYAGVKTGSEGSEPDRYVVIYPSEPDTRRFT